MDGEEAKPIILHAFPDKIPEFNEFYILKLVNISGTVFFCVLFYFHVLFILNFIFFT